MTSDEIERLDAELDWLQDAIDERIDETGECHMTLQAVVSMAQIIMQAQKEAAN